jgi:hypothetical protein
LFTRLAERTYAHAAGLGFDAVCGVANGNSTPGFTRKLGFALIEPLHAAVGAGRLSPDPEEAAQSAGFRYVWSEAALNWRCASPANRIALRLQGATMQCAAPAAGGALRAYAELPAPAFTLPSSQIRLPWAMPRLFLGLIPGRAAVGSSYWAIPQRLRPSPLNFIFRPLQENVAAPRQGEVNLSFLDFDAY